MVPAYAADNTIIPPPSTKGMIADVNYVARLMEDDREMSYSEFMTQVQAHQITDVKVDPSETFATYRDITQSLGRVQVAGSENLKMDPEFVKLLVEN